MPPERSVPERLASLETEVSGLSRRVDGLSDRVADGLSAVHAQIAGVERSLAEIAGAFPAWIRASDRRLAEAERGLRELADDLQAVRITTATHGVQLRGWHLAAITILSATLGLLGSLAAKAMGVG